LTKSNRKALSKLGLAEKFLNSLKGKYKGSIPNIALNKRLITFTQINNTGMSTLTCPIPHHTGSPGQGNKERKTQDLNTLERKE
jgi:hypothetical protein